MQQPCFCVECIYPFPTQQPILLEDTLTQTLSDFLVPEAVDLGVDATDASDVICRISARLLQAGYTRESFTEAVLEREKTIPTGLPLSGEHNAAIPHTDVEHVLKPGIGMATLVRPVVFKNMVSPEETVEVRLVFVLALEQPKSQIEMLQEVAQVLQRPDVVAALMEASTLDQVHEALKRTVAEKS
jgi:PTS system galactitol-specific IIA component